MKNKYKDISFIDVLGVPEEFYPKPASKFIPEWYQQTPSYFIKTKSPDSDGFMPATIKKCIPVFDAITTGYVIVSFVDIHVSKEIDEFGKEYIAYKWPKYENPIHFHPEIQALKHPLNNGYEYPKWINPWTIKTPKGYSVYIKNLPHTKGIFTIMEGVVDTDKYLAPINLPFVLNDPEWTGIIDAGTPIAQVIPFKRESWQMSTSVDILGKNNSLHILRPSFSDWYKKSYRTKKDYK
jgi:hypothetical protein